MAKICKLICLTFIISFWFLSPQTVYCKCPQLIAISRVMMSGNITSPGWPSPYPPDAVCAYKLQGEPWHGVKITFHYFDLEPPYSAGCLTDYLELNTVNVLGHRTFRGRFCGNQAPAPILVLHPVVELVFRSNHAAHHDGFAASYEFIDERNVKTPGLNATSPCSEVLQGIGGVIESPGYPRGYVAGLDCLWLIRVEYSRFIYMRLQHLEFQGSTANCQKAQLRIYDGYEHSLEDTAVLKKFCGDTRYYKGEEGKVQLSDRNRLLIRFTTTEPSKPVNDSETMVGFRLVWSEIEYKTQENCTREKKFPCEEASVCIPEKGTSSCPELKNYCISNALRCDGLPNCSENDPSDERNCMRTPLVITVVATPLSILTTCLLICFVCYKRSNRKRELRLSDKSNHKSPSGGGHLHTQNDAQKQPEHGGGSCCSNCCCCCCLQPKNQDLVEEKCHPSTFGQDSAPITRGPIYFKNDLESPGASDIVSPASGFSDSESDIANNQPIFCPAHGPVSVQYVPLRYISRHFPLLPVVQEAGNYQSDIYDEEGGSIYSSQNSDMIIYEDKGCLPLSSSAVPMQSIQDNDGGGSSCSKQATSTGLVNEWRLKQLRRVQRSDAIYMSDDNKSSVQSSPGRVCPRCLEKDRNLENLDNINFPLNFKKLPLNSCLGKQNSGVQFDSGIDVVDSIIAEPVKNVSFETCTSSDSAISQGFNHYRSRLFNWREKFCPPPMVEEVTQTDPSPPSERRNGRHEQDETFCETITTFGVKGESGGGSANVHKAKATDV